MDLVVFQRELIDGTRAMHGIQITPPDPEDRRTLERNVLNVFRRANRTITPSADALDKSGALNGREFCLTDQARILTVETPCVLFVDGRMATGVPRDDQPPGAGQMAESPYLRLLHVFIP